MKDIKFRAFHKPTSKKMFDVVQIDFTNKIVFSYERIHNTSKYSYFDTVSYNFSDCELMQYTGLTDCEGKEIFEGDIVEVEFDDYYSNDFFTIDEGSIFIGKIIFESFGYYIEFDDTYMSINDINTFNIKIKILGNIHQNPELLEKKSK